MFYGDNKNVTVGAMLVVVKSNSLTLLNDLTVMSVGFVMSFVVKLYFPCVM